MKHFKYKKHPEHKKHFFQRGIAWFMALLFTMGAVSLVNLNATEFQTSIIPTNNVPAFNGTVLPVQKIPNWVALTSGEWDLNYSQLSSKLINIPAYEPSKLLMSTDSLTWGNPTHDAIRNAKITYSVPYMGSYKLDGREMTGSHLALDMKLPEGTPIYAIANAEVDKTSIQSSGFGNHIVLKHPNVSSYESAGRTETYYSSYSHLKTILVSEGSIINKGQLIGYSGDSGLSSTPHLHFQIDNSSAPWHPYWPFTSQEASAAGYSFTQAVNEGLNQGDAIAKTVNPMMWVQKYKDGTVNIVEPTIVTPTPSTPTVTPTSPVTPIPVIQAEEPEVTEGYVDFEISGDDTFRVREPITVKIRAIDENGNTISDFAPSSPIRVEITRGSAAVEPDKLTHRNFINGIAEVEVTSRSTRPVQLRIKSDYTIKESSTIVGLNESANSLFADISSVHPNFKAISYLKNEGIIEGYPDGTFKPTNSVSRVEVIKFILEGIDADLKTVRSLPFSDTSADQWYGKYLYTAVNLKIIEGYPDGTFKPSESVNKVEFLKMLISAMNIDIDPDVGRIRFSDVKAGEWYAKYAQFAVDKNIIDIDGSRFNPTERMKREDIAEAIYRVKVLKETGATSFTAEAISDFEGRSA